MMKFERLSIPDVVLIESPTYKDERGFFQEIYHKEKFDLFGISTSFVQDNRSRSVKGVLRGLHYQVVRPQGKLVCAVRGNIFDVAVDLRKESATFGRWVGEYLSEENKKQLWIPPGFAHGFLVLSDEADVVYKCTDFYAPEHERTIFWNDPVVGIEWPYMEMVQVSTKDMQGAPFKAFKS